GHQLQIVRAERVVVEVVLDCPKRIEAEFVSQPRQPDLLVPRLVVAHALPAISGEHHLDADVHNFLRGELPLTRPSPRASGANPEPNARLVCSDAMPVSRGCQPQPASSTA